MIKAEMIAPPILAQVTFYPISPEPLASTVQIISIVLSVFAIIISLAIGILLFRLKRKVNYLEAAVDVRKASVGEKIETAPSSSKRHH